MLEKLRKYFKADAVEEKLEESKLESLPELDAELLQETLEDVQESLQESLVEELASVKEVLAETVTLANAYASELDEMKLAFAKLQEQLVNKLAEEIKLVAVTRKEKLEAAVGTAQAEILLASLETLDNASFEVVVGAMAKGIDDESKSKAFVESGVTVEAVVPALSQAERLATKLANENKQPQ